MRISLNLNGHTLKCHRISFELLSEVFVIHWERFETLWTPFGIQWRSSEIPLNAKNLCKCNGNSLGVEETVGNSQAIPWNSKKPFQSFKNLCFLIGSIRNRNIIWDSMDILSDEEQILWNLTAFYCFSMRKPRCNSMQRLWDSIQII